MCINSVQIMLAEKRLILKLLVTTSLLIAIQGVGEQSFLKDESSLLM